MLSSLIVMAAGIAIGLVVAFLYVAAAKPRYTTETRRDAVSQSRAVTRGQIYEQFATYFPGFDFNPKDAQFLGKPVDFVVFDGLDDGKVRRIVFIEVKTGGAKLNARERCVRDAVRAGAVEWRELRLGAAADPVLPLRPPTSLRAH
jgi:predicted Holliday junction resolvase-like endonuclease